MLPRSVCKPDSISIIPLFTDGYVPARSRAGCLTVTNPAPAPLSHRQFHDKPKSKLVGREILRICRHAGRVNGGRSGRANGAANIIKER